MTALKTLLGLGVMSPRSVGMASGRGWSIGFKGFAQNKEVAKINKAMVEMVINFNVGVNEDDNQELLEVLPEKLTNVQLSKLEQEHEAKEEAREQDTAREA